MFRIRLLMAAIGGVAAFSGSGNELVYAQATDAELPKPSQSFAPSTVYPSVREYHWTFHVPTLTFEDREATVTAPIPTTRPQRWDYQGADIGTERRSIGKIPEFSCKYPDLLLPNECRTVWRDVYVDLPVLVERHQHIDVDVPEWRWQKQWFPIVVPRWTWSDKSLTVSVPTIVTEKP